MANCLEINGITDLNWKCVYKNVFRGLHYMLTLAGE